MTDGAWQLPKHHLENEIGAAESQPDLARRGTMGLVVAILLLTALVGGLVYAPLP